MPMVDKFPAVLREDLEAAFREDVDVFNVAQVCVLTFLLFHGY